MSRTFAHRSRQNCKVFRGPRPHGWEWQSRWSKKRTAKAERVIDKTLCRDLGEESTWSVLDHEMESLWDDMLDWGYNMASWGADPIPRRDFWNYGDMSHDYDRFQLEQYNRNKEVDHGKNRMYKRCA